MRMIELNPDRNYGIDFLRILSMFFVLLLHIFWQGGILDSVEKLSLGYNLAWFIEICAYCAVNCYALISGYFGYTSRHNYSKIINLYFLTAFYALLATGIFYVMSPESVGEKAFIRAVLPIGFDVYWYFSAYFCVFFFAPFFNKILEVCDEKQLTVFVIISVTFFSIFPVVFNNDIFITNNGFSALWLSVLYIIGGYIRKYEIYKKIRNSKCMLLYFAGVFVTFGHKVITEFLRLKINGEVVDERLLIQYTSPTILLCAVALLCFFAKVNLKESLKRFTSVFSPLAFSVYLIHTAPFVWTRVMKNRFVCLTALNPFFMVLAVFGFAVGIFLLCSLVDFVRMSLFKMLKVNKLSVEIEKLITKSIDKIVKTMHLAGDSD